MTSRRKGGRKCRLLSSESELERRGGGGLNPYFGFHLLTRERGEPGGGVGMDTYFAFQNGNGVKPNVGEP